VNIPQLEPGQVLVIADGRATIISREAFEQMRRGNTDIPDQPIASMEVSAENVNEAIRRVLGVLKAGGDGG
jgi:hypothetical protein